MDQIHRPASVATPEKAPNKKSFNNPRAGVQVCSSSWLCKGVREAVTSAYAPQRRQITLPLHCRPGSSSRKAQSKPKQTGPAVVLLYAAAAVRAHAAAGQGRRRRVRRHGRTFQDGVALNRFGRNSTQLLCSIESTIAYSPNPPFELGPMMRHRVAQTWAAHTGSPRKHSIPL